MDLVILLGAGLLLQFGGCRVEERVDYATRTEAELHAECATRRKDVELYDHPRSRATQSHHLVVNGEDFPGCRVLYRQHAVDPANTWLLVDCRPQSVRRRLP